MEDPEKRFEELDKKIDFKVGELESRMKSIEQAIEGISNRLEELEKGLVDERERLLKLESSLKEKFEELSGKLGSFATSVKDDVVREFSMVVEGQVGRLREFVEDLESRLGKLKGEGLGLMNKLRTEMLRTLAEKSELEERLGRQEKELKKPIEEPKPIRLMEERFKGIEESLKRFESDIQRRISKLERDLADFRDYIVKHFNELVAEYEKRFNMIRERLGWKS
jgi:chromosome segregation ATPase